MGPSVAAMMAACAQDTMPDSGPPTKSDTRDSYYVNRTRVRISVQVFQELRLFIIMSALPPAEHPNNNGQPSDANKSDSENPTSTLAEVAEMDTTPDQPPEETWDDIPEEIMDLDTEDVLTRIRLIDNDIKVRLCVCGGIISIMNFGIRSCVQSSCG